jgi:Domain of unknown function (DUF4920)
MKHLLLLILTFTLSSVLFAQTSEEKLGKEITLTQKTNISDILADPESYLDKTVLVEGEVLDVCHNMGCWMDISTGVNDEKIKIKVKDGEIVFPVEAIGSKALVEGKVYKIELSEQDAKDYYEHMAEENGKTFDPSTVTGPVTLYQIKGIGAKILKKES